MAAHLTYAIPPLEPGDHLSRAEFERRYEAMPNLKKAELIDGIVYIPEKPRVYRHAVPNAHLIGWLGTYAAYTPGVQAACHSSVRLSGDNETQPDALLFIVAARGGQTRISEDDFLEGPPEFVGETASTDASYELHCKMRLYERVGVREYVVRRVLDQAVDWFVLRDGRFTRIDADKDGVIRSRIFPGLWLDSLALANDNAAQTLAVVNQGLASPEHAAFVAKLNPSTPTA